MTTQTTTDRAVEIRQTLKAKYGWTRRDVSVKSDYYSMGSSIRIRIKNPTISSAKVEAIAQQHEAIDRDQWGEILSGGNRFVFVNYDHETLKTIGARYLRAILSSITQRQNASDRALLPIAGTPYLLGSGMHGNTYAIWHPDRGHLGEAYDPQGAAELVGVLMLNEGS